MKLRELVLLFFLASQIVTISGLTQYWNPNLSTLSQVLGNYTNRIYFFFIVNLVGMLCLLVYENTFKDIVSMFLCFILAVSYMLLLWISEDIHDSLRHKSHVVLSALSFSCVILYILYHAIRLRDPYLGICFALSVGLFSKIVYHTRSAFLNGGSVEDMFLEEISMVVLCIVAIVRRGGYI
jgi:hypothetical protein